MDGNVNIEICCDWQLNDQKEHAWQFLSENHYNPNVFLALDWLKLWWEVYSTPQDKLQVIYVWQAQEIIAIFPIYLQNGSKVRFVGTGEPEADEVCSEYLDILVKNNNPQLVCEIIGKYCHTILTTQYSIEFNNILENSHILTILSGIQDSSILISQSVGSRYYISLPTSYQIFEQTCSKSFISQANRKMRKFKNLSSDVIQVKNQNDLSTIFNKLAQLHNTNWHTKGVVGAFESDKFKHFHYKFAKAMLDKGCLSMTALKIDNVIVGVIYNFTYHGIKAFYQMGIDSTIKHNISVGTLLHLIEIESSINSGTIVYDFMKGDDINSYKGAYTQDKTPMFNVSLHDKNLTGYYLYCVWRLKKLLIKLKGANS